MSSTNANDHHLALLIMKNGQIIECNDATIQMFSLNSKNEIIGSKIADISPFIQHDGNLSSVRYNDYFLNDVYENRQFQWTFIRVDRSQFFSTVNRVKIQDTDYIFITNMDYFNQLNKTIKEKDYLYRILFHDNRHIMLLINPENGYIVDANKAAVQFYGYSYENLISKTIYEINELTQLEVYNNMQTALHEKRNFFLFKHKLSTGELRDVEVNSFPITIDENQLLFTIVIDITEKVKQNLFYNNLFINLPTAIVVLDENLLVKDINNQFTTLFGYQFYEVEEKNLLDLLCPSDMTDQCKVFQESLYKGNIVITETIRKRKDQKLLNVKLYGFPIIYNDQFIGAYINFVDITDKVNLIHQIDSLNELLKKIN